MTLIDNTMFGVLFRISVLALPLVRAVHTPVHLQCQQGTPPLCLDGGIPLGDWNESDWKVMGDNDCSDWIGSCDPIIPSVQSIITCGNGEDFQFTLYPCGEPTIQLGNPHAFLAQDSRVALTCALRAAQLIMDQNTVLDQSQILVEQEWAHSQDCEERSTDMISAMTLSLIVDVADPSAACGAQGLCGSATPDSEFYVRESSSGAVTKCANPATLQPQIDTSGACVTHTDLTSGNTVHRHSLVYDLDGTHLQCDATQSTDSDDEIHCGSFATPFRNWIYDEWAITNEHGDRVMCLNEFDSCSITASELSCESSAGPSFSYHPCSNLTFNNPDHVNATNQLDCASEAFRMIVEQNQMLEDTKYLVTSKFKTRNCKSRETVTLELVVDGHLCDEALCPDNSAATFWSRSDRDLFKCGQPNSNVSQHQADEVCENEQTRLVIDAPRLPRKQAIHLQCHPQGDPHPESTPFHAWKFESWKLRENVACTDQFDGGCFLQDEILRCHSASPPTDDNQVFHFEPRAAFTPIVFKNLVNVTLAQLTCGRMAFQKIVAQNDIVTSREKRYLITDKWERVDCNDATGYPKTRTMRLVFKVPDDSDCDIEMCGPNEEAKYLQWHNNGNIIACGGWSDVRLIPSGGECERYEDGQQKSFVLNDQRLRDYDFERFREPTHLQCDAISPGGNCLSSTKLFENPHFFHEWSIMEDGQEINCKEAFHSTCHIERWGHSWWSPGRTYNQDKRIRCYRSRRPSLYYSGCGPMTFYYVHKANSAQLACASKLFQMTVGENQILPDTKFLVTVGYNEPECLQRSSITLDLVLDNVDIEEPQFVCPDPNIQLLVQNGSNILKMNTNGVQYHSQDTNTICVDWATSFVTDRAGLPEEQRVHLQCDSNDNLTTPFHSWNSDAWTIEVGRYNYISCKDEFLPGYCVLTENNLTCHDAENNAVFYLGPQGDFTHVEFTQLENITRNQLICGARALEILVRQNEVIEDTKYLLVDEWDHDTTCPYNITMPTRRSLRLIVERDEANVNRICATSCPENEDATFLATIDALSQITQCGPGSDQIDRQVMESGFCYQPPPTSTNSAAGPKSTRAFILDHPEFLNSRTIQNMEDVNVDVKGWLEHVLSQHP